MKPLTFKEVCKANIDLKVYQKGNEHLITQQQALNKMHTGTFSKWLKETYSKYIVALTIKNNGLERGLEIIEREQEMWETLEITKEINEECKKRKQAHSLSPPGQKMQG